jgi:hypothetical protein
MLWTVIDNLKSSKLSLRSRELKTVLDALNDAEIVEFQSEAASAFRQLFTPGIYYLYCAVYEGEVNGEGLRDFCSNIMLSGHSFFIKIIENPDAFAELSGTESLNDDFDSVSNMGRHILIERHGEDEAAELLLRTDQLHGIWKDLENAVGNLTFKPNWPAIRLSMPRVYARWGKEK